jgi:peptide/nickel transport system ATP-binding protein
MYAGEIVEVAQTSELFAASRHPYTNGLIQSGTVRDYGERFGFIPGSVAEPGAWPAGCRFAPRCDRVQQACTEEHPSLDPLGEASVRCINPVERGA